MKIILGLIVFLFLAAVFFFVTVAVSGLAISSANSWILDGNFSDAWSSVWQKKFVVFGWAMLFFSLIAITTSLKK